MTSTHHVLESSCKSDAATADAEGIWMTVHFVCLAGWFSHLRVICFLLRITEARSSMRKSGTNSLKTLVLTSYSIQVMLLLVSIRHVTTSWRRLSMEYMTEIRFCEQ